MFCAIANQRSVSFDFAMDVFVQKIKFKFRLKSRSCQSSTLRLGKGAITEYRATPDHLFYMHVSKSLEERSITPQALLSFNEREIGGPVFCSLARK